MNRVKAILIGLATCWPFLYMSVFVATFVSSFFSIASKGGESLLGRHFAVFFGLHILTMLVSLGLMIYFIVHLFRSSSIPNDKKPLWAIILFMGGIVAMPIYWFLHIWKPLRESPASGTSLPEEPVERP